MGTRITEREVTTVTQNRTNASQIFAVVQQIASQISKDRILEMIGKAQGLDIKENQLVVDLLGIAFEKSHHLLKNPDRVLLLLSKLASSANIVAKHRTINFAQITPDLEASPNVYKLSSDPPVELRVVRQGKKEYAGVLNERLVTWAHLSHVNILPIYGAFLEGEDGPVSLVSPCIELRNIVDHAKTLSQEARMPLFEICDVIDGLCYLHSLNIVHGSLNPQNIFISPDGRALITGLDNLSELSPVRYSAPEILDEDDADPKMASDVWSLGCVVYEVLCGKVPFYQIRQEGRVGAAVMAGKKPLRPGHDGTGVEKIGEAVWGPVSTCWESEVKDRPSCLQIQKIFSSMVIHDNRPVPKSTISPETSENEPASSLDLEPARSILTRIVGANLSMGSPSQIPAHLRKPLFGLIDNRVKAEAVAVAATKLNPNDTQIMVDVLDLIWEEASTIPIADDPIDKLLSKIMMTTHTLPQRYRINRVRYDSGSIAEGDFGEAYKGRDLEICVSVVTNPSYVSLIFERFSIWARSQHSIVFPLYGVFYESSNEISQFCLVSPYLKNGLLRNYTRELPQKDRVPLIYDVINALVYVQGLNWIYPNVRGDRFLISNEGRALICAFGPEDMLASLGSMGVSHAPEPYAVRFYSPETAKNGQSSYEASVWSFGCLIYEVLQHRNQLGDSSDGHKVLSRKPPYHQYTEDDEIRSALSRGEPLRRPSATDDDMDEIDNQFWDLIGECRASEPGDRLTMLEIQKLFENMEIQDDRPEEINLPEAEALVVRPPSEVNWDHVKQLLDQIQVELLRNPLSSLVQNHTKEVAAAAAQLTPEDTRTLVDFLDLALKDHITLSDQRNRVLALLSRITTSTHIFPRRYELKGIKYSTSPTAGGGFGTVHRGVSDPNICVKVMVKVDPDALMNFVKELILWAHASHQNVLPFYGVFVDDSERICLVSPFMTKGNLRDYAPRLPQKKRIPLLYDVIKGLIYLHGLGIVHTDLKGENVLISDEGRGLITDFGASHVITATAKGGATAASVASTLRFTAPEIILNRHRRPMPECDIWSFGCLCYEVLSRKSPYFEYSLEAQIIGQSWDEFDEPDWDEIDNPSWSLITHCCTPKPESRPTAVRIEELIVDLKMWNDRPETKGAPSAHLISLRSNPDIDLNRAGELLNALQVRFLVQSTLRYPPADVAAAIKELELEDNDARALVDLWDVVLNGRSFTLIENNQALALLSALICSSWKVPDRYKLPPTVQYSRVSFADGSFGTVHRGDDPNLCIKVTNFNTTDPEIDAQILKGLAPSAYSWHPNILPFYGAFFRVDFGFLVSPFIRNGNLHDYALRLPQELKTLVVSDVVEALLYLHGLGIVHGNLKGENILISDEGRALVADFRPYHINIAAAENKFTGSYVTNTLRFTAPELVKNSEMLPTTKSDVCPRVVTDDTKMLSRKVPFYQHSQDVDIRSALARGELPARPASTDDDTDVIEEQHWNLITKCCTPEPVDRLTLPEVQKWLANLDIEDNRIPAKPSPGAKILKQRVTQPGVDIERMGDLLARIKSQLPPITQEEENEEKSLD